MWNILILEVKNLINYILDLFQFLGIAIFSYEGICTALPIRESMDDKSLFKNVFY